MAMTAGFPDGEGLPERIGPYTIRRKIGQGGMGVVYQAVDPQNNPVAVKVLRPEVAGDEIARARLAREVETMRRVHSRNVAEVIDADTAAPRPWVVTEYIPGPTLESTVTDHGPLRGRALTRLVSGLAQAIDDIHAAGVIHRDLKPGNVIISNGNPIVIDFGIAHAVDGAKLTQTGTFVGTPSYLSPEVIEGTDLGPSTDVHAWGATVAFAATGSPPYGAGAFEVIFFRILNGEIKLDGMHEALQPLVQRAVSRDMRARPTSAELLSETGRLNLDLPWAEGAAYQGGTGMTGKHTVQGAVDPQRSEGAPSGPSGGRGAAETLGSWAAAAGAGAAAGGLAGAATYGDAATRGDSPAPRERRDDRTMASGSAPADRTMAAGSAPADRTMAGGEVDRTMAASPDDPQRTGLLPGGDSGYPDRSTDYDEPEESPQDRMQHTMYYNSTLRPEDFEDILTPVEQERKGRRADHTATFQGDDEDDGERKGLLGRFGFGRNSSRGRSDGLGDYFGNDGEEEYDESEPRRFPSLILVPLALILAGLTMMLPVIGFLVALLASSILGALDKVKGEHARRLQTRGPRGSDSMVVALSMPWALVRNAGSTLVVSLGFLVVGLLAGSVITVVMGVASAVSIGTYGMFAASLGALFFPPGVRRQSVWLTRRVGIRNVYVYIGSMVAVGLIALFMIVFGFSIGSTGGGLFVPIPQPNEWFG
ncbi:serine/threonine protein kinase [Murinocardiopsis flavida]|uniref:Serine/threonine protein kinase n=1 Tax=Murinocardiopsis flavida TaxID=645275 RepID=A0A2P8DJT9_9ACTN|nr:protein kinase [Murinocardiopsis flavida]PSK97486.1 serine/threonine protein kinase [Murinocardiopsis flavida]